MRLLFAGTPEMAVPSLYRLAARFEVVGVLTAPDRRKGRKRGPQPSPVKAAAESLGLPVMQPPRLNGDARAQVQAVAPDLLVVVAYGRIFGPRFMALFPHGGVNLHPSLLPRHRGPSPIPAAILAGDSETGITVQQVAPEMDSGDILAQQRIPLTGTETTASLTDRVAREGAVLLEEVVAAIVAGTAIPVPQDHDVASYCRLIEKSDGRVDWTTSAAHIERMSRAFNPWPGTYTYLDGRQLTLWETSVYPAGADPAGQDPTVAAGVGAENAPGGGSGRRSAPGPGQVLGVDKAHGILVQTGDGVLAVRRLQLQSRGATDWKSFLNGVHGFIGCTLE
ncbi:MAG: methionyl-tRNA formyltransferase [Spirochaetota bacterium]